MFEIRKLKCPIVPKGYLSGTRVKKHKVEGTVEKLDGTMGHFFSLISNISSIYIFFIFSIFDFIYIF